MLAFSFQLAVKTAEGFVCAFKLKEAISTSLKTWCPLQGNLSKSYFKLHPLVIRLRNNYECPIVWWWTVGLLEVQPKRACCIQRDRKKWILCASSSTDVLLLAFHSTFLAVSLILYWERQKGGVLTCVCHWMSQSIGFVSVCKFRNYSSLVYQREYILCPNYYVGNMDI